MGELQKEPFIIQGVSIVVITWLLRYKWTHGLSNWFYLVAFCAPLLIIPIVFWLVDLIDEAKYRKDQKHNEKKLQENNKNER